MGGGGRLAFGTELPNWAYHHITSSGIALANYSYLNASPAKGLVLFGNGLVVPECSEGNPNSARIGVFRREFQNALQYAEKGAPITIASEGPGRNQVLAVSGPAEKFIPYPFSL